MTQTMQIKTSKAFDSILIPIFTDWDHRSDAIFSKIADRAFTIADNEGILSDEEFIEDAIEMANQSLKTGNPIYRVPYALGSSFYFVESPEAIKDFLRSCRKEFDEMAEEGEQEEIDLEIKEMEMELALLKKKQKAIKR